MANDQVVETLKKIKNVFKDRGWIRINAMDCEGQVCFIGAWAIAEGKDFHWQNDDAAYGFVNESPIADELAEQIFDCGQKKFNEYDLKSHHFDEPSDVYIVNDKCETYEELEDIIDCAIKEASA